MGLKPASWNGAAYGALAVIVLTWASIVWATWGHWGYVTIDCGREVYVPSMLAQGKTLYRDVWYLYGPLAPYFNSLLFQVFGTRLETAFCAGSLSALGCAIFLFLAGMRAGCMPAGWTAGMVVVVQAFVPSLFCFPFPYSFASVYGCVVSCAFLWVMLVSAGETGWKWFFAAAWLAALGMLLKLEYGTALYGGLILLWITRFIRARSRSRALWDVALSIPGILVTLVVIRWMIGLGGLDFLLQENLMSWPTSYFMRTYGQIWVAHTMGGGQHESIIQFGAMVLTYLAFWIAVRLIWIAAARRTWGAFAILIIIAMADLVMFCAFAFVAFHTADRLYWFAVPKFAPLLVAAGTCYGIYRCVKAGAKFAAAELTLAGAFSILLCLRLLNGIEAFNYSIFYDGPVIACLIPLLAWAVTPRGPGWLRSFNRSQAVIGIAMLFFVGRMLLPSYDSNRASEMISTPRGSVYTSPAQARAYRQILDFIAMKSGSGERVLSVPEDTSLYFLSGTAAPARVYAFTPGLLAPGKMTREFLNEIDSSQVAYVLWSNRTFPEYRVATGFGVDFDQPVGDYIHEHFDKVSRIPAEAAAEDWQVEVWHRKGGTSSR